MSTTPQRVPPVPISARGLRASRLRRPAEAPEPSHWRRLRRGFSANRWGKFGKGVATFATLATGLAAVGALWMTSQTLDATRQQTALSEQGQYTDRFGRAVEQLGAEKINNRLGGIYALERLAKDSPRDANTITRLLGAYVRENTLCPAVTAPGVRSRPPTDIAAALTVLTTRDSSRSAPWADVTGACLEHRDFEAVTLANLDLDRAKLADTRLFLAVLRGVRLQNADLSGASLEHSEWLGVLANLAQLPRANLDSAILHASSFAGANLTDANLHDVSRDGGRADNGVPYVDATLPSPTSDDGPDFRSANLTRAQITNANLDHANFTFAILDGSNFSDSRLQGASFMGNLATQSIPGGVGEQVRFDRADLRGASFVGRDMRRMSLVDANLAGADLRDSDLRGVDLSRTDLTSANLQGAKR